MLKLLNDSFQRPRCPIEGCVVAAALVGQRQEKNRVCFHRLLVVKLSDRGGCDGCEFALISSCSRFDRPRGRACTVTRGGENHLSRKWQFAILRRRRTPKQLAHPNLRTVKCT